MDRFNIKVSITKFSKYFGNIYKYSTQILKLITGSVLLNVLSYSIEVVNFFMLSVLFVSCLHNFMQYREDIVKQVKFYRYNLNLVIKTLAL